MPVCDNLLLCLTVSVLLLTLSGNGITNVLIAYLNSVSCVQSLDSSADLITTLLVSLGTGMVFVHGLLLPKILSVSNNNFWLLLIIGNCFLCLFLLCVCVFYYAPGVIVTAGMCAVEWRCAGFGGVLRSVRCLVFGVEISGFGGVLWFVFFCVFCCV